jgi:hypothetical protein
MTSIEKYVIANYPVPEHEKESVRRWYADIAEQMLFEQIEMDGHLTTVQIIIEQLSDLHLTLLEQAHQHHIQLTEKALKYITQHQKYQTQQANEIEICFEMVYSAQLLMLEKKGSLDPDTNMMYQAQIQLLHHLSQRYKERQYPSFIR